MPRKPLLSLVGMVVVAACSGPSAASTQAPASVAATPGVSSGPSKAAATQAAGSTTSAIETPSTFTSPLYGYSLTLPAGWAAGAAVLRWDGKSQPGNDEPVVDKFGGPVSASAFAFAGSVTFDLDGFVEDRIKANARDHGDTCPATPEAREPIEIGGQPAVLLAWNCGILINQAVTVHAGTGFAMTMRDVQVAAATDPADRATFEALLHAVTFPG